MIPLFVCFSPLFETMQRSYVLNVQMWPLGMHRSAPNQISEHFLASYDVIFFHQRNKNFWYSCLHVFLGSSRELFWSSWSGPYKPASILVVVRNIVPSTRDARTGNSCSKTSFAMWHKTLMWPFDAGRTNILPAFSICRPQGNRCSAAGVNCDFLQKCTSAKHSIAQRRTL